MRAAAPPPRLGFFAGIAAATAAAVGLWGNYKVLFPKRTHGPTPPPNAAALLFGNRSAVEALYRKKFNSGSSSIHSVPNTTTTTTTLPSLVLLPLVFYNIYIPNTPHGARGAVAIVREQLRQVAAAVERNGPPPHTADEALLFCPCAAPRLATAPS